MKQWKKLETKWENFMDTCRDPSYENFYKIPMKFHWNVGFFSKFSVFFSYENKVIDMKFYKTLVKFMRSKLV